MSLGWGLVYRIRSSRYRVDHPEELGERRLPSAREVAPVRVHVLAEQRDLAHAVSGQALHLGDQLGGRAAHLPPARRGHDAVRAHAVAAHGDLHPRLVAAGALHRQAPREALELEVALGGQAVARQELGQLGDLAGPEGDVDERELLEDALLHRLRPATPDPDDPRRVLGLEAPRLPEVGDEAAIRLLPDGARVEEDEVGLVAALDLGVAERVQHPLHPFGVVLVHLAPERREVVALHPLETVARPEPPPRRGVAGLRPYFA
jgi:hypothetical protein